MVKLDEGGNTLAWQLYQSTAQGQQALNGKAPGGKPAAVVTGLLRGDKLHVHSMQLK